MKKIIKEENKTAVMITHDIAEAISLSDRIVILKKTPTNRRSDKSFSMYYEKIWKMINKR